MPHAGGKGLEELEVGGLGDGEEVRGDGEGEDYVCVGVFFGGGEGGCRCDWGEWGEWVVVDCVE